MKEFTIIVMAPQSVLWHRNQCYGVQFYAYKSYVMFDFHCNYLNYNSPLELHNRQDSS